MAEREVAEKVERAIRDCLGLDPEEDIADADLYYDLGVCKLDITEIVLDIEHKFRAYNLEIDEDMILEMQIGTVYDIIMYVCSQIDVEGH